jgi:hypothetical protein
MEERSIRENLGEKVIDLEEQLASVKDSFEKASAERDSQSATVDGLQRALQEIQAGELLIRTPDRCALLTQRSAQAGASRTRREL